MLARLIVPLVAMALLAAPAAADNVISLSTSASASASFSAGVGIQPVAAPTPVLVRPAPAPVYAQPVYVQPAYAQPVYVQPAYAQPVYVQPAPPTVVYVQSVAPPPPVVVVRQVAAPPMPVVVAAPACGACVVSSDANLTLAGAAEVEDDDVDILVFGRYRNILDDGELGGFSAALRILFADELSLETKLGYTAGGTPSGGAYDEVPFDVSLLWYPWQREFPIYFAFGGGFAWAGIWHEDESDPFGGYGGYGAMQDVWFVDARTAVGLEFELWDFLLLTAETEMFYRADTDESGEHSGPGVSVDLGVGIRI